MQEPPDEVPFLRPKFLVPKLYRRIEIVIVPDLSSLPGYDELEQIGAHPGNAEKARPDDGDTKATPPSPP